MMSANAERAVSLRDGRNDEIIADFDAERLKAPFLLRCGAMIIDYILIIFCPVLGVILARMFGYDGTKLFKSNIYDAGIIISFLLAATNFFIFPMFAGQSLGKMLTGLRIVSKDGNSAGYGQILMRHLIGYPLTLLTAGVGFLLSLFNAKGRTLHDLISGTNVIYGRKKVLPDTE